MVNNLTWRRFSILLRGLGPHSSSMTNAWYRRHMEEKGADGDKVVTIRGKEQTTAAFVALFGSGHQKKDESATS